MDFSFFKVQIKLNYFVFSGILRLVDDRVVFRVFFDNVKNYFIGKDFRQVSEYVYICILVVCCFWRVFFCRKCQGRRFRSDGWQNVYVIIICQELLIYIFVLGSYIISIYMILRLRGIQGSFVRIDFVENMNFRMGQGQER